MAKDWWESYAPATESKDNWWSGYAVEDAARRELPEGVKPSEAGGGRGSAPASAYVRPPEAAPVARAETPPAAAEYTDAMGNALGGAEMPYGMEPAPSVKSVLNTPQATRDLSAEAFAKENPVLGALASGSGQIVSGLANAIPTMVDFAAKTVNLLSGGQLEPEGFNVRAPTYDWADRLAVSAKSAMPEAGKQNLASAVSKGEFASWLGLNLTAQAPQMVGNFIAALAPVTRPFMLPAMGAQTAGQAYGEGDSSLAAVLKGGAEILGEKATLGIFDHSFSALSKLPLSLQAPTVQSVGRALAATGKVVTAQAVAGSIEEATTQIFQNGVDKFVEGKNVGLLDQVTDAAVLGAFMQGPLAIPQTVKAFQGGAGAFGEAFAQDVAGAQYAAPADVVARRLLDVQSYDANIITPQQTAKMAQAGQAFGKATSAEDVVAAANLMAGSVDELLVPNTIVPPTAAAPTLPEVTAPTELPPIPGLPAAPAPAILTELPPVPGLPAAPAPAPLPAVNPETEKLFGLDKLRLNAPRPQSIQGEPVANLTDDKLTEIVNDESVHAMTRRGAAIELTARQAEQAPAVAPIEAAPIAAPTPVVEAPPVAVKTMTPAELGQMRLGDRRTLAREFDQTENDDGSITFTPKPPSAVAPAAPETNFGLGAAQGRVSNAPVTGTGDTARADLQARLDETAAQHNVAVPTLAAPAKSDEAAVTAIGKALGVTGPVVAYADPNGADGFELGGAIAINTKTQKGIAPTAFHENFHIAERIAEADTQAGRTDTPAQQYVSSIHSLFNDMSEAGKRSYAENFLHKKELARIADPVAREQRLQQLLSGQTLRSEMAADFMGNRATDRTFLADLAKADPKGFGGFVQKWIGILDNMLVRLRGVKDKTELESVKVDSYLKDLNQAKMVARDAMVAFRNGTLQQSAPATAPLAFSQQQGETNERINVTPGGEVAPGLAGTAGQIPALGGGGEIPSYGTAREGAVSVVGRHYSTTPRQSLSGAYYGRGLKGAEATRLDASTDPRLKNRVYFYADQGAGIRPESGVGGHAHEVQLNNIYDPASRLIKPQVDANAFESAVINAGFDGYMAPFGNNQSAVVLLGQKHKAVPVRAIGQPLAAAAPQVAAPTTLTKGLLSREANAIDVTNIPGAQVRMGNLQIPAGQTEAANVELARIGSDVRFSAKQKTVAEGGYENITSSRQAQASLALANNQWLESGKTKATGGISTTEFVDALRANEGAAALTLYDADEVKAGVKDGSFKIYQLGKEGGNKNLQIFFGLKRGKPWYADMVDGIKDNEVEVVSVTNNEPGASGVATPAIITKAIAEGATVLDAFAVKSKRFPDGFLPQMYGQFGFETIGTIPFDASYYDANKLSDLKAFWAKGGWKEADGYPDVVVMRWKGKDADRKSVIERYVRTGETGVSTGPDYFGAATGNPAEQRDTFRGAEGRAPGGDNGPAGRIQGADNAAPVVRRAYNSLQELANLSAGDIRNLGLKTEDVARLRDQLASGATPDLESVFAGLDKRGMAKAKAETAFTSRPDGAQIKFVQDNFLDILAELDDSGLVKINCD